MPVLNRMAEFQDEVTAWRRDFHRNPELLYDVHETAAKVARILSDLGCEEVVSGIGQTGVVAVIHGKNAQSGPVIGLRADMDALPILEATGKEWSSSRPGVMHACGHDGHTAMLLGAARYLAEFRNFGGKAVLIFQPAEEGGAGAKAMIEDGLMDRFGIQEVYGLHNMPGLEVGRFAIRSGAIMAAADEFNITITGKGGHAAQPHKTVDPVLIAAHCIHAFQAIVSRGADPLDSLVISVTQFDAGSTHNVISDHAVLKGTVRSLNADMQSFAIQRMEEILANIPPAFGGTAEFDYKYGYPVTRNHVSQTEKAVRIAQEVGGDNSVEAETPPVMGGEDFSFMLMERPGAFIFMGNGDSAGLHNPAYDFNDEAIPFGSSYWVRLVETLMPAGKAA